jgi:glycine/D-amino acid oxidase-like deaminating enzyme
MSSLVRFDIPWIKGAEAFFLLSFTDNESNPTAMVQTSVWEEESFYAPRDLVIVGSGFVGLWCAYYLKKKHPKISIAIVDRGIIPTGASTRNAGFACFGSVTELISDTAKMGEDQMLEMVELRYRGLKKIRKVFSQRQIGYDPSGGFELITADQGLDINTLRTQIDRLNQQLKKITGGEKAFRMNDPLIADFGFAGVDHLVENRLEGQLHSGRLCQALLRLVQSMGVVVLNNVEITHFEKLEGSVELHTNHPFSLRGKQLLVCTNAFAKQLLPDLDVEPARGQVLVTSPIEQLRIRGTFHYDEGFYYFRNLGKRILLGGARNKAFQEEHTTDFATSDFIQQNLEDFLRRVILPSGKETYRIEHRWSGIMGIGSEKKPIVRELDSNIFCAVRMAGMGVALAPEIGKMIAEKLGH